MNDKISIKRCNFEEKQQRKREINRVFGKFGQSTNVGVVDLLDDISRAHTAQSWLRVYFCGFKRNKKLTVLKTEKNENSKEY